MGSHKRQCNRRRTLGLEMLETRELMSTVAVAAHRAAEVSPLARQSTKGEVINGWLAGPGVWSGNTDRGTNGLIASGTATTGLDATPFGAIAFNGNLAYKAVHEGPSIVGYRLANGTGTLTDSTGGQLDLRFTGELYESGTTYAFSWTGTLKGGRGDLSKATGTFSAWGTYDIATGAFQCPSITLKLTRT